METNLICKEHRKVLEMYCGQCKALMCVKCLPVHANKSCKHPTYILSYAESELLPLYKERFDSFEKNTKTTDESIKEFLTSSKIIKGGLVKLKVKFEGIAKTISQSIEFLEASEKGLVATKESIKNNVIAQYEEFKEAIESENLPYIIKRLDKPCASEINDGETQLIEALKKATDEIMAMEKLNGFHDLLSEFSMKHQLLKGNDDFDKQNKYIYGSCYPQKNYAALCRYDIQRKKLECVIDIPRYSSVICISGRIFISGGSPLTNATEEYFEETSALLPKAPMKYSKNNHTIQIVGKILFATVGGYNETYLSCCEEYSIVNDKWEELPSLNTPRHCAATIFLDNKLLYAIGGINSDSGIEVLNYSEKKTWTVVNIMINEIVLNNSPKALILSKNEILVFSGNNDNIAGLWNLKANSIKNYANSKLNDYYFNQVYMRNRKGYVFGHYGHVHIFDLNTRKFTEFEYSNIFP
eukprot:TRINITY_DN6646_c0_g1_i7.p1 TRINITY_DN6646_c0_g1~~TRINITY_DN6646_c0_g1_i7.p1  ORF type:complete len:488 (-),score=47.25 TRINITY_DN6646_c0_g1_i7:136-1542(-)